jgi:hypothetical protein
MRVIKYFQSVTLGIRLAPSDSRREPMTLIIQKAVKRVDATFILSGRINGEEVAELQSLFAAEGKDHRIVLDLKEVKLVSLDAVRFLAHCEENGIKLKNCPSYIRVWIMREAP